MGLIAVTAGQRNMQKRLASAQLTPNQGHPLNTAELLGRQADLIAEQAIQLTLAERHGLQHISHSRPAVAGGNSLEHLLHRRAPRL